MKISANKFVRMVSVALALALVAGCVSGNTPEEKFHSRMRADPVPPSDFLPHHELLVKQPNIFPFHYFYLKEDVVTYQYVHIAEVNMDYIKKSEGWDAYEAKMIEMMGSNAEMLCDFTRKAFEQAFRKKAEESGNEVCLEVTDRKDQLGTLIVEPAFIAISPTKAELNYVGTSASFFVFGANVAASLISAGSMTMECRIRDAQTGEIIAMFADTESDPKALLSVSSFSRTASTRINVKEIARMTAEVLSARDYRTVKRNFPYKFISKIVDANLDEE